MVGSFAYISVTPLSFAQKLVQVPPPFPPSPSPADHLRP